MVGGLRICGPSGHAQSDRRNVINGQRLGVRNIDETKLNTKISTEAELVAVDDWMPQILWTKMFLQAQGYKVRDNIINQDNQSAIKLENNGCGSSGKRTRHLNIRYFFVTDRIKKGDVRIIHCPTDMLIADFYTKPLQGKQFRVFRNLILNLEDQQTGNYVKAEKMSKKTPINTCSDKIKKSGTKCQSQECVGHNKIRTYKDVLCSGIKKTQVD